MNDLFGRELKEGDQVVYTTRSGSVYTPRAFKIVSIKETVVERNTYRYNYVLRVNEPTTHKTVSYRVRLQHLDGQTMSSYGYGKHVAKPLRRIITAAHPNKMVKLEPLTLPPIGSTVGLS